MIMKCVSGSSSSEESLSSNSFEEWKHIVFVFVVLRSAHLDAHSSRLPCNNFYAMWNHFACSFSALPKKNKRLSIDRNNRMGKWEYEFDFCQLFGNTVQRAFIQMYSIVCRVVLSHAPSATEFIQLQFLENAKDAAAAAATATTMNLHGFSLHAQFIFMLNSAFMALHSIKFDFYSCTIKRIQTTNGRQRDGGEARRKSSKCTFFVSDSARCSFGLLVQSSFYLVSLDVCLFDGLVPQPTHIHTRHTHAGFSVFYLFMTRQNVTCDATRYYAMQVHCLCAQEKR